MPRIIDSRKRIEGKKEDLLGLFHNNVFNFAQSILGPKYVLVDYFKNVLGPKTEKQIKEMIMDRKENENVGQLKKKLKKMNIALLDSG
jgi:hypothetical protein